MQSEIASIAVTDFDRGVIESLGARLIDITVDGSVRKAYAMSVDGLTTNVEDFAPDVPVYFAIPEDVFQPFRLPCIVVRRNDLRPAFDRAPFYGYQRAGAPGSQVVRVPAGDNVLQGYSSYIQRVLPTPFDISYDVQVYARRQVTGITLLTRILQSTRPPFFTVAVNDSLGDRRLYDAGEVVVSSNSELADISDRTIAWTISFDVRGEIDLEAQRVQDSIVTTLPEIGIQVINLQVNVVTQTQRA
jgi:hypothetical protein